MSENQELQVVEQKPSSALVEIEKSRAVQEVQAQLIIAKKFPRDKTAAVTRIVEDCKRFNLASVAMYRYPKGGQVVTGASIRLAEVMAQNYGNLDFGVREIERRGSVSIAESYCWDLESNTRQVKVFEVPHEIWAKGKMKRLTDPRDIYELVANQGSRRLRACILGIIPADIQEAAVNQVKKTLAAGNGEPLIDRIRKMVLAFKEMQITQEMIAKFVEHEVDLITPEELVELQGVYTSIRDKQAKISDFFDYNEKDEPQAAQAVNDLFKGGISGKKND
jgi:hypothetical protein